ncbi:zinc ribbon domain-containing protein [Pseudomonas aeruginosa]|uniref:zinc ribbon domain-containing protein n=1 Tax=Pseudomonas aeruginosa TaxID=287 RepID=UPI0019100E05|nr:zinc ribbon domain-containing protein [Pseudomonas aeruginosa]
MGVIMDRAVVITAAVITAVRAAIRRRQSRRGGALAPLRCIACNADLAAGAKFCGACGAPQQ